MHMLTTYTTKFRRRQQGSTLVVTMMLLILIMMLGVTAMVTSDTQFKLTGNLQFEDVSMNRAESTVAAAESWLATGGNKSAAGFANYDSATPHLHPIGHLASLSAPANNPLTMVWSDSNSMPVVSGEDTQRYLIEKVSHKVRLYGADLGRGEPGSAPSPCVNTYLITARGTSIRGATKFIQSYFSVLNC
jgi:Tfp pilus assembly protein PilX